MAAGLAIHALRARVPARAEPVAARLALQALGADLEDALPRGLPPQALLWLRRLQLQAPEAALRRPASLAWRQDWIAAGRERLDAALAHAARPALGAVPHDAEAVLFADTAEMLACLAWAARAGQLDRWWWRGLLGRAWPAWQTAWAARPQAQAAAQRLLQRAGQGRVMAFDIEPGDAAVRAERLRSATWPPQPEALSASHAGDAGREAPRATAPGAAADAPPRGPGTARAALPGPVVIATPRVVVEGRASPAAMAAVREAVVGPQVFATPPGSAIPPRLAQVHAAASAGAEVREALRLAPGAGSPVAAVEGPSQPADALADADGPAAAAVSSASRQHLPLAASAGSPTQPAAPAAATAPGGGALPPAGASAPGPASHRTEAAATAAHPPLPEPGIKPRPGTETAAAQAPASEAAWPWPQALLTGQAPLLFLVNVLLEDGLYPDFTRPRDRGLPVPLWALLAALARAWRLPADPLQAVLAERAGAWGLPEHLLNHLPAAPGVAAGPWRCWLPAYARALRRRLCRRLGLPASQWPAALTLAHPARLWLSEAEWVAEFDLGSHDVAWRLAGLDRDPGWLPAVDCSLRFEFR